MPIEPAEDTATIAATGVQESVTTVKVTKVDPVTSTIWIDDAKKQFWKLWSVRFSLSLSILAAIQAGLAIYDKTNPIPAIATAVMGIVIAFTRIIKQTSVHASNGFEVDVSTETTVKAPDA